MALGERRNRVEGREKERERKEEKAGGCRAGKGGKM